MFYLLCLSRKTGDIWQKRHKTKTNKNIKHNMICVGHHQAQDTRGRQTKTKTQHDMCWTPLRTNKHKQSK
jgi:hypothetical protein